MSLTGARSLVCQALQLGFSETTRPISGAAGERISCQCFHPCAWTVILRWCLKSQRGLRASRSSTKQSCSRNFSGGFSTGGKQSSIVTTSAVFRSPYGAYPSAERLSRLRLVTSANVPMVGFSSNGGLPGPRDPLKSQLKGLPRDG